MPSVYQSARVLEVCMLVRMRNAIIHRDADSYKQTDLHTDMAVYVDPVHIPGLFHAKDLHTNTHTHTCISRDNSWQRHLYVCRWESKYGRIKKSKTGTISWKWHLYTCRWKSTIINDN
jgi:hypothetical protein